MDRLQRDGYEFGSFQFFPASGELHDKGRIVRCPAQTALVLAVLLQHAGEVVTREQLRAELWPEGDSLSYDDAINKAVSYLRHALRDSSRTPRFIQTLSKRGYRFVAEVTPIVVHPAEPVSDAEEKRDAETAAPPTEFFRGPRWRLRGWRLALLCCSARQPGSCVGKLWRNGRKRPGICASG